MSNKMELQTFRDELAVFKDATEVAKTLATAFGNESLARTLTAINWGRELGISPVQSVSNIHIIGGKPILGAGVIATLIKKHPNYKYKVVELSSDICKIEFFEKEDGEWESIGVSEFTIKEAQTAKLTGNLTWQKYPKNMLFARALANGARWYCADIFGGAVYDESEIEEVKQSRPPVPFIIEEPIEEIIPIVEEILDTPPQTTRRPTRPSDRQVNTLMDIAKAKFGEDAYWAKMSVHAESIGVDFVATTWAEAKEQTKSAVAMLIELMQGELK